MADRLDLADFREILDLAAHVMSAERRSGVHRRHVERGQLIAHFPRRAQLEQQRLVLIHVRARLADHRSPSQTRAKASISSRRAISVAHSSMALPSSG